MPRTKKKVAGKENTIQDGASERGKARSAAQDGESRARPAKQAESRPGQRKRGWRDIEAISERARLKKMLSDIWHEDVELDEDIFGDSDHLAGYYTDVEVEVEEVDEEDDLLDDEDFDETE